MSVGPYPEIWDYDSVLDVLDSGERIGLAPIGYASSLIRQGCHRVTGETGPVEIARENGQRRIWVEVNVRGRDVGSFVEDAAVARDLQLPPGYIVQ